MTFIGDTVETLVNDKAYQNKHNLSGTAIQSLKLFFSANNSL